jgi:hypothetical protein
MGGLPCRADCGQGMKWIAFQCSQHLFSEHGLDFRDQLGLCDGAQKVAH